MRKQIANYIVLTERIKRNHIHSHIPDYTYNTQHHLLRRTHTHAIYIPEMLTHLYLFVYTLTSGSFGGEGSDIITV